jgi:hypothetical protein
VGKDGRENARDASDPSAVKLLLSASEKISSETRTPSSPAGRGSDGEGEREEEGLRLRLCL